MNSLRDRVYPVTRSSNASECDVTFERYCMHKILNCISMESMECLNEDA